MDARYDRYLGTRAEANNYITQLQNNLHVMKMLIALVIKLQSHTFYTRKPDKSQRLEHIGHTAACITMLCCLGAAY